jgi:FAD:protein FMN transferase
MATSTSHPAPGRVEITGALYHGIPCRIRAVACADVVADAWRILERIDAVFNVYRDDSELGMINVRGPGVYQVSPWLSGCLRVAQEVEALSGGAWSATMLPVVRLWRQAARSGSAPAADAITGALAGAHGAWALDGDRLHLRTSGAAFDLGGLAKGFAVDQVVAQLRSTGVDSLLVQVGGETACQGRSPDGGPHRIGIPHPDDPDGAWCAIIQDPGQGLGGSTSGDYRLGQHILDPRSGRPAASGLSSVTCVFPTLGSNALADGLTTAISVLGPDGLAPLARATGCEGCLLRRDPARGLLQSMTPGWSAYAVG